MGKIIPLISAKLSGSSVQSNIVNGVYTFGLPYNSSGAVKLYKDNEVNKDNGVSGIDVVLEQSHILGKNILNSPYKLIAADINGDGKITALDIVYMKRVILGIDTTFTNSTTKQTRMWAFVNNGYVFPDITNPFPYNDSINFINQDSSVGNKSFTGMKLGDVNWDWDAAVARPNNNTLNAVELSYSLANTYPSDALPGRTDGYIHIPVRVKNFRDLLTMQFTINFDTTVLKWNGIDNNLMNFDLGTNHAEEGKITFLWNDPHNEVETLADGSVLFELVFQKIDNGQLIIDNENTNTISLDGSVTKVEAYDKDYGLHGVVLNRVENIQPLQVESWTVAPNPTTDGIIHVQMNLRDKKTIVFRLSDNTGKVVMVMQVEGVKGSNTINLRIGQQLTMGVYYLKAEGVEGVKELIIKN